MINTASWKLTQFASIWLQSFTAGVSNSMHLSQSVRSSLSPIPHTRNYGNGTGIHYHKLAVCRPIIKNPPGRSGTMAIRDDVTCFSPHRPSNHFVWWSPSETIIFQTVFFFFFKTPVCSWINTVCWGPHAHRIVSDSNMPGADRMWRKTWRYQFQGYPKSNNLYIVDGSFWTCTHAELWTILLGHRWGCGVVSPVILGDFGRQANSSTRPAWGRLSPRALTRT